MSKSNVAPVRKKLAIGECTFYNKLYMDVLKKNVYLAIW